VAIPVGLANEDRADWRW